MSAGARLQSAAAIGQRPRISAASSDFTALPPSARQMPCNEPADSGTGSCSLCTADCAPEPQAILTTGRVQHENTTVEKVLDECAPHSSRGFYTRRIAGCDYDHAAAVGLHSAARRTSGTRGRSTQQVREQSAPGQPGHVEFRKAANGGVPRQSALGHGSGFGRRAPGNWSAQSHLLPFLEETITFNKIDYTTSAGSYLNAATGYPLQAIRIPTFVCPDEVNDTMATNATAAGQTTAIPQSWPINYAVNMGPWFVFDPTTGALGTGGPGSFFVNSQLKMANFTDGTSKTLMMAEVKAYQPHVRNLASTTVLTMPTIGTGGARGPLWGRPSAISPASAVRPSSSSDSSCS